MTDSTIVMKSEKIRIMIKRISNRQKVDWKSHLQSTLLWQYLLCHALAVLAVGEAPVGQIPPVIQIALPVGAVLQIIGVFPQIHHQQRCQHVQIGHLLVGGILDRKAAVAAGGKPGPAWAGKGYGLALNCCWNSWKLPYWQAMALASAPVGPV